MGKRALPPMRFSPRRALRFEPFEVIVMGVGLLLLLLLAISRHLWRFPVEGRFPVGDS